MENNFKIIIGTRLYSNSINNFDCLEASSNKDTILKAAKISNTYLVPSLKNQTDKEFEHFTIINNYAPLNTITIYKDELEKNLFKTTLIRNNDWDSFIKNNVIDRKDNNICISRIDYDDCIHKNAIETIKKKTVTDKTIIYGWTNGLRYRIGTNVFREYSPQYSTQGHMSVLQSCLIGKNSKDIDIYNPYKWDHSNIRKSLKNIKSEEEINELIVNGNSDLNDEYAYIWIRHENAASTIFNASFDKDSLYKIIDVDNDFIFDRFGLNIIQ